MDELLLGCSGWSYADPAEKGGWTGAFYPDSKTRRLAFYASSSIPLKWIQHSMKNFTRI